MSPHRHAPSATGFVGAAPIAQMEVNITQKDEIARKMVKGFKDSRGRGIE